MRGKIYIPTYTSSEITDFSGEFLYFNKWSCILYMILFSQVKGFWDAPIHSWWLLPVLHKTDEAHYQGTFEQLQDIYINKGGANLNVFTYHYRRFVSICLAYNNATCLSFTSLKNEQWLWSALWFAMCYMIVTVLQEGMSLLRVAWFRFASVLTPT